MGDDQQVTRRTVIATGAAASAALAGCTGGDDPEGDAGGDGAPDAAETPTATPSAPTLEDFEYPDGASQDGVDGSTLADTHREAITGAGSMTLEISETRAFDGFTSSSEYEKRWGSAGVSKVTDGDVTETLWSPEGERLGYVQMDTGFEQRYRIDNRAPSPEQATEVARFEGLVAGVEWDAATEVVEDAAGDYGVVYEGSAVADENAFRGVIFGEVTDIEASITVSEAGHVSELVYDVTTEQQHGTTEASVEATVTAVGETALQAPEWLETAKSEGTRFEMGIVDDGEVVELELVNGGEVPADATVRLSSGGLSGRSGLPEAVSVGDRLNLALAAEGDLRVAVDGAPAESTALDRFVRATVRLDQFTLFEGEIRQ